MTTPRVKNALCSLLHDEFMRFRSFKASSILVPDETKIEFLALARASYIADSKLIRFSDLLLKSKSPFVTGTESVLSAFSSPPFLVGDVEPGLDCFSPLSCPFLTSLIAGSFAILRAVGSVLILVIFSIAVFCFMASR